MSAKKSKSVGLNPMVVYKPRQDYNSRSRQYSPKKDEIDNSANNTRDDLIIILPHSM